MLLSRPEFHEGFDALTMRAVRVEPGSVLVSLQALLRPGGEFLLFRGPTSGEVASMVTPPARAAGRVRPRRIDAEPPARAEQARNRPAPRSRPRELMFHVEQAGWRLTASGLRLAAGRRPSAARCWLRAGAVSRGTLLEVGSLSCRCSWLERRGRTPRSPAGDPQMPVAESPARDSSRHRPPPAVQRPTGVEGCPRERACDRLRARLRRSAVALAEAERAVGRMHQPGAAGSDSPGGALSDADWLTRIPPAEATGSALSSASERGRPRRPAAHGARRPTGRRECFTWNIVRLVTGLQKPLASSSIAEKDQTLRARGSTAAVPSQRSVVAPKPYSLRRSAPAPVSQLGERDGRKWKPS